MMKKHSRYGRNSSIQVRKAALNDVNSKYNGMTVSDMVNPRRTYKVVRPLCDNLEKSISWSIAKEHPVKKDYVSVVQKLAGRSPAPNHYKLDYNLGEDCKFFMSKSKNDTYIDHI